MLPRADSGDSSSTSSDIEFSRMLPSARARPKAPSRSPKREGDRIPQNAPSSAEYVSAASTTGGTTPCSSPERSRVPAGAGAKKGLRQVKQPGRNLDEGQTLTDDMSEGPPSTHGALPFRSPEPLPRRHRDHTSKQRRLPTRDRHRINAPTGRRQTAPHPVDVDGIQDTSASRYPPWEPPSDSAHDMPYFLSVQKSVSEGNLLISAPRKPKKRQQPPPQERVSRRSHKDGREQKPFGKVRAAIGKLTLSSVDDTSPPSFLIPHRETEGSDMKVYSVHGESLTLETQQTVTGSSRKPTSSVAPSAESGSPARPERDSWIVPVPSPRLQTMVAVESGGFPEEGHSHDVLLREDVSPKYWERMFGKKEFEMRDAIGFDAAQREAITGATLKKSAGEVIPVELKTTDQIPEEQVLDFCPAMFSPIEETFVKEIFAPWPAPNADKDSEHSRTSTFRDKSHRTEMGTPEGDRKVSEHEKPTSEISPDRRSSRKTSVPAERQIKRTTGLDDLRRQNLLPLKKDDQPDFNKKLRRTSTKGGDRSSIGPSGPMSAAEGGLHSQTSQGRRRSSRAEADGKIAATLPRKVAGHEHIAVSKGGGSGSPEKSFPASSHPSSRGLVHKIYRKQYDGHSRSSERRAPAAQSAAPTSSEDHYKGYLHAGKLLPPPSRITSPLSLLSPAEAKTPGEENAKESRRASKGSSSAGKSTPAEGPDDKKPTESSGKLTPVEEHADEAARLSKGRSPGDEKSPEEKPPEGSAGDSSKLAGTVVPTPATEGEEEELSVEFPPKGDSYNQTTEIRPATEETPPEEEGIVAVQEKSPIKSREASSPGEVEEPHEGSVEQYSGHKLHEKEGQLGDKDIPRGNLLKPIRSRELEVRLMLAGMAVDDAVKEVTEAVSGETSLEEYDEYRDLFPMEEGGKVEAKLPRAHILKRMRGRELEVGNMVLGMSAEEAEMIVQEGDAVEGTIEEDDELRGFYEEKSEGEEGKRPTPRINILKAMRGRELEVGNMVLGMSAEEAEMIVQEGDAVEGTIEEDDELRGFYEEKSEGEEGKRPTPRINILKAMRGRELEVGNMVLGMSAEEAEMIVQEGDAVEGTIEEDDELRGFYEQKSEGEEGKRPPPRINILKAMRGRELELGNMVLGISAEEAEVIVQEGDAVEGTIEEDDELYEFYEQKGEGKRPPPRIDLLKAMRSREFEVTRMVSGMTLDQAVHEVAEEDEKSLEAFDIYDLLPELKEEEPKQEVAEEAHGEAEKESSKAETSPPVEESEEGTKGKPESEALVPVSPTTVGVSEEKTSPKEGEEHEKMEEEKGETSKKESPKGESPKEEPSKKKEDVKITFIKPVGNEAFYIALSEKRTIPLLLLLAPHLETPKGKLEFVRRNIHCGVAGTALFYALNHETPPCDSMFQFVCSQWIHQPSPKYKKVILGAEMRFLEHMYVEVRRSIERLTVLPGHYALSKVGRLYRGCLDRKYRDGQGALHLKRLMAQYLLLDWPLEAHALTDVEEPVAKYIRDTGSGAFITVRLVPDPDDPNQYRKKLVALECSSFVIPMDTLLTHRTEQKEVIKAYKNYISHVASDVSGRSTDAAVANIFAYEVNLANRCNVQCRRKRLKKVKVNDLMTAGGIDWVSFLRTIFDPINYAVTSDSDILVRSVSYLKKLSNLFKGRTVRTRTMNYLGWRFMHQFARHSSTALRKEYREFYEAILAQEEVADWKLCLFDINEAMPFAMGRVYADYMEWRSTDFKVHLMVTNLIEMFDHMVRGFTWLPGDTLEKFKSILTRSNVNVGFPRWILNDTTLNAWHSSIPDTAEYTKNYALAVKNRFQNHLKTIAGDVELNKMSYFIFPSRVVELRRRSGPLRDNLFYDIRDNAFVVPAGTFRAPYYNPDWTAGLNFGGLGYMVARDLVNEFFHAVDAQWMGDSERQEYKTKSDCIMKAIAQSSSTAVADEVQRCAGVMADFLALRLSYSAYHSFLDYEDEGTLPGMEGMNPDQIFFIAAVRSICTQIREQNYVKVVRLKMSVTEMDLIDGMLKSMDEFKDAFSCDASPAQVFNDCFNTGAAKERKRSLWRPPTVEETSALLNVTVPTQHFRRRSKKATKMSETPRDDKVTSGDFSST
ncbi:microtubule-associated protein futsch-like isoform X2 [Ornithodoros turicata]|uniref:microtubule-associated protein futsch-like isoform X2 n=1 Tax=Ornithodoros turicata TaxID=34597 RepID=UPI0031387CD9